MRALFIRRGPRSVIRRRLAQYRNTQELTQLASYRDRVGNHENARLADRRAFFLAARRWTLRYALAPEPPD